jgi:hypothetical protein
VKRKRERGRVRGRETKERKGKWERREERGKTRRRGVHYELKGLMHFRKTRHSD